MEEEEERSRPPAPGSCAGSPASRRLRCVIHVRRDAEGDNVTGFSSHSWERVQQVIVVDDRKFEAVDSSVDFRATVWPVDAGYHRKCYQQVTNKTLLERGSQSMKDVGDSQCTAAVADDSGGRRTTRQTFSIPKVSEDVHSCIICSKVEIRCGPTGRKTVQKTSLCQTQAAATKLINAAAVRRDERIQLAVGTCGLLLVDRGLRYHKSCYNDYTRAKTLEKLCAGQHAVEKTADGNEIFIDQVREQLFVTRKMLTMSVVNMQYREWHEDEVFRNDKLKKLLLQEFGDAITFFRTPKNDPERVYATQHEVHFLSQLSNDTESSDLDSSDSELHHANQDDWRSQDEARILYHAAIILRAKIRDHVKSAPKSAWPPSPEANLSTANGDEHIPPHLHNFLAILSSDQYDGHVSSRKVNITDQHVKRQIWSTAQDIVHICTPARPPKHVALAVALHHMFRSHRLIRMLNRLGHCISYAQVLEIETAVAEKHVHEQQDMAYLPGNINPSYPFHFVWDNNDLNEETLSGAGTTHCTNGIVVQRGATVELSNSADTGRELNTPSLLNTPSFCPQKRRRSAVVLPTALPQSITMAKCNPPPISSGSVTIASVSSAIHASAQLQDILWALARLDSDVFQPNATVESDDRMEQEQTVPAWSAFNALLCKSNIPAKCTVGYCPVINSSPTEMSTVYSVLCQSMNMARLAGLNFTIIVFDQAIYAKAVDLVLQRPTEFKPIVLHLGGFHISLTFLAVLGKRFKDAGLADVLIESTVGGSSSVQSALDGRHYNRAVRMHKLVAESLVRMRWRAFLSTLEPSVLLEYSQEIADGMKELQQHINADNADRLLDSEEFRSIYHLYNEFCDAQAESSPMFKFWSSYIDLVFLLLRFIRSCRSADWALHLSCIQQMFPWFFAYDRPNYARYGTLYWIQMTSLPESNPAASKYLADGGFVVQRPLNSFA